MVGLYFIIILICFLIFQIFDQSCILLSIVVLGALYTCKRPVSNYLITMFWSRPHQAVYKYLCHMPVPICSHSTQFLFWPSFTHSFFYGIAKQSNNDKNLHTIMLLFHWTLMCSVVEVGCRNLTIFYIFSRLCVLEVEWTLFCPLITLGKESLKCMFLTDSVSHFLRLFSTKSLWP